MEHFTDRHRLVDAQDIADVAAYVSSLRLDAGPVSPSKTTWND
jgi:hypothetical protein